MTGQKDLLFDFGEEAAEPSVKSQKKEENAKVQSVPEKKAVDVAKTEGKEDTEPLKEYGFGEIMKSSTEYFGGDELAASVWANKYELRDEGHIYGHTR